LRARQPRWRDGVQEWLFQGFDLWAPSWDLSLSPDPQSTETRHLLGQLGSLDEADSLPVLIDGRKANDIRDALANGPAAVLRVAVHGMLTHVGHLLPGESAALSALQLDEGGADYCLVVREDDQQQELSLRFGPADVYSGYLWQCWGTRRALTDGPHLEDAYFIWEHTNFSNRDAIQYNLESLEYKTRILARRVDDPVLLQKSHSWLVPGEPLLSTSQFYELLVSRAGSMSGS
jgi:hypothetical protein